MGRHRLPGIAALQDLLARRVDVVLARVLEPLQLLPGQRHRHRRSRGAPQAVGADDRLGLAVAVDVDQHLVRPLVPADLQGRRRPRLHEGLGQRLGGLEDGAEAVARLQGRHHVDPLAARGLAEGVVAEGLEVVLQLEGEGGHLGEGGALGRVEVEDEVVGLVEVGPPRVDVVQLDGGVVGQPHEAGLVGGDHVVDALALGLVVADALVVEPLGAVPGAVLLEEALAVDAVGEANQGEGPPLDVGQDRRRHGQVVLDHLGLEDAVLGPQHLLEVGQLDAALADLGHARGAGHGTGEYTKGGGASGQAAHRVAGRPSRGARKRGSTKDKRTVSVLLAGIFESGGGKSIHMGYPGVEG